MGDKIAEFAFPSAAEARRRGASRAGAESGDLEGTENSEARRAWRYGSGDVVVTL